jgi:hypothetical protein
MVCGQTIAAQWMRCRAGLRGSAGVRGVEVRAGVGVVMVDVHHRQARVPEGRQKGGDPDIGVGISPGVAGVAILNESHLHVDDQKRRSLGHDLTPR